MILLRMLLIKLTNLRQLHPILH